jgi:hypothetical protein
VTHENRQRCVKNRVGFLVILIHPGNLTLFVQLVKNN